MAITANGTHIIFNDSTTQATQAIEFVTGTVMLFGQTAAPTGWTKLTDQDNAALRVVSGTASTGGSQGFTTAFASQTPTGSVSITAISGSAGSTTLSTPQIPSHSHPANGASNYNEGTPNRFSPSQSPAVVATLVTNAAGGGGSHDHPFSFSSGSGTFSGNAINLAVKFVDLIIAQKN